MNGLQKNKLLFICILIHFFLNIVECRKPRIINGDDASASDFKYIVAILCDGWPACGGAIIGDRFVLTAAHCVYNQITSEIKASNIIVRAATKSWHKPGIDIDAEKVYIPKEFANGTADHDIAVLKLERSLEIEKNSDKLQALQLPPENLDKFEDVTEGYYIKVNFAGFGTTQVTETDNNGTITYKKSGSGSLKYARAEIVRHDDCRLMYYSIHVTHNQLCVRTIQDLTHQEHQGFCSGDSGSPLVLGNMIAGVASANTQLSCNSNISPDLFTRVSSFVPFINDAMKDFTSNMVSRRLQTHANTL